MREARPGKVPLRPRNLTALQGRVLGNPANSRPESGVANCYPGLELDQRTFENVFFPGLRFEYHRSDGAILVDVAEDSALAQLVPQPLPLLERHGLYLWGVACVKDGAERFLNFKGLPGIEVWDRIRSLEGQTIKIAIGTPAADNPGDFPLRKAFKENANRNGDWDFRADSEGWSCYVGRAERPHFVTSEGVIDPTLFPPGDLTKTMCAPWIYDFRDCFCFYWAANKPDIVADATVPGRQLDFLRKVRDPQAEQPDVHDWTTRLRGEVTIEELASGAWNRLPVILNDREVPDGIARSAEEPAFDIDRERLVETLGYLATVEHALMIEYLFAYYSIRSATDFVGDRDELARIQRASALLRTVAIDEMHHLHWVNRMLATLGSPPSLGRASFINEAPKPPEDPDAAAIRPVQLRPLTAAALQDFIDAERNSGQSGQGVDGLYTRLLEALRSNPRDIDHLDELIALVKLIIDEGVDHFATFEEVRAALAGIPEHRYLRPLDGIATPAQAQQLALCDIYYASILDAIQISFTLDTMSGLALVRNSVRTMQNLDEIATALAIQAIPLRFTLSTNVATVLTHDEALERVIHRRWQHSSVTGAMSAEAMTKDVTRQRFDTTADEAQAIIRRQRDEPAK